MYSIVYTKKAVSDIPRLKAANLAESASKSISNTTTI